MVFAMHTIQNFAIVKVDISYKKGKEQGGLNLSVQQDDFQ